MERDILPMCKSEGLGVTPWGVVGAGKFTGRFKREDGVPQPFRGGLITERDFNVQVILIIA